MDEASIEVMYEFDWQGFNAERTYRNHTQEMPSQRFDDDGDTTSEDNSALLVKFFGSFAVMPQDTDSERRDGWLDEIGSEKLSAALRQLYADDIELLTLYVFEGYSKDTITVTNADKLVCGGTGCGPGPNLPVAVEHSRPDYGLYPQFPDTAYGFLTRGCPNQCGFCVVSGKEGNRSVHTADLSEFWNGQKEIKLMDANLLACPDHERLIAQLADSRAMVDFSQELDIRLITPDNVALLNKVRTKAVRFAWDNPHVDLTGYFQRFSELSKIRDFRRKRVYVLTNFNSTHKQDLYRVDTLRRMGFNPYVMVYERPTAPPITRHLQRWVNNKRIFRTVERFADYEPVKKLKVGGALP